MKTRQKYLLMPSYSYSYLQIISAGHLAREKVMGQDRA